MNLRNEKGTSLVTALVAVAITSIVGLAVASIAQNMGRVQETAKARENATSTMFLISSYLQDSQTCKKSLLGSGLSLSAIEAGRKVASLTTNNNVKVVTTKGNEGISSMVLEPINENLALAQALVPQGRYMAQLKVEFQQKESLLGGGVAPRTVPIALILNDSNQAIDCRAMSGTEEVADSMELLLASPHMDSNNCLGQYFPLSDGGRTPSSVLDVSGLRPVDPKTRFKLLTKVPPQYIATEAAQNTRALTRGPGYGFRHPDRFNKKWSSEIVTLENHASGSSIPGGMVKEIDGKRYYVTPTIDAGTAWGHHTSGSGCGDRVVCSGGSLVSSAVGHHCGGGNR